MSTPAQVQANQANAQHSTGPRTEEGKARASRNNTRHGLTLGVLTMSPEERVCADEFEAKMRPILQPFGPMEEHAFRHFLDGAARLRRIEALIGDLIHKYNDAPVVVPETEATLNQLNRYRAAAEMLVYRSIGALREMQTTRLQRRIHLTAAEAEVIPESVRPPAKLVLNGNRFGRNDREIFYTIYKTKPFTGRLVPLPWRCPRPSSFMASTTS